MYAVISSGGKQYRVEKDAILRVEKIQGEVGSPVTFDKVLMYSDGENIRVGTPVLEEISVQGHIVEQDKEHVIKCPFCQFTFHDNDIMKGNISVSQNYLTPELAQLFRLQCNGIQPTNVFH